MLTIKLKLIQAKEDEPPFSNQYQAELRQFLNQLPKSIDIKQTCFVMDSVLGGGGPLGEFIIPLAKALIPALTGAAGYWLKMRIGRKLYLKVGDIEAEATNAKDFNLLLEKALLLKQQQKEKVKQ
jgi:hypothetical protein